MSTKSWSNDTSEIEYETLNDLCVQSVSIFDEVFEPDCADGSQTLPDAYSIESHGVRVASENAPISSESKQQQSNSKYLMNDEILLPCTYCFRIISYENYEKHLTVHTLEHTAIINRGQAGDASCLNQLQVTDMEENRTIVCRVCGESVPANIFKHHLADHMNNQTVLPIEAVMIKEEVTWNETENYEVEDSDPIDTQNEFQLNGDSVNYEKEYLYNEKKEQDFKTPLESPSEVIELIERTSTTDYHERGQVVHKREMTVRSNAALESRKRIKSSETRKLGRNLSTRAAKTTASENTTTKKSFNVATACTFCHRIVSPNNMRRHVLTHLTKDSSDDYVAGTGCRSNKIPSILFIDTLPKLSGDDPEKKPNAEKPFVCFHCDEKFTKYSELRDHQARREDEKPFLCMICYRAFYQCYHLKTHHMAYHKNSKFIVGEASKNPSVVSANKNLLPTDETSEKNDELRGHRVLSDKRFPCSYCKLIFNCYKELSEHIFTHKKETSVMCTLCRKSVRMENVVHKRKGVFMCSFCSSTLLEMDSNSNTGVDCVKKINRSQPIRNKSKPQSRFLNKKVLSNVKKSTSDSVCENRKKGTPERGITECEPVTFVECSNKPLLELEEPLENSFKITECQERASRRKTVSHLDACDSVKTIKSSEAKKQCKIIPSQVEEMTKFAVRSTNKVDENAKPCTVCHRAVSFINMEKHMLTHAAKDSSKDTNGNDLELRTSANSSVIDLLLEENLSGEKPFVCFHCDQKFRLYSELRDHQAFRKNQKRFLCTICYRTFYQCHHLKMHHLSDHKNLEFVVGKASKKPSSVVRANK